MSPKFHRLRFPDDAKCMVPGCQSVVKHVLNLRIRNEDTGAIYGPNLGAYLCHMHGRSGGNVAITWMPRVDGEMDVRVNIGHEEIARHRQQLRTGNPLQPPLFPSDPLEPPPSEGAV